MTESKTLAIKKHLLNSTLPENPQDIVQGSNIYDREDPDSVFNRAPLVLQEAIIAVENNWDAKRLVRANEEQMRNLKITPQQQRLRIAFWDEFARAIDSGGIMRVTRIYAGVMHYDAFVEEYINAPMKFALILNLPPHYNKAAQEILMLGLERLRDIMELPLVNAKGAPQSAVIMGILKAVEMLDRRVKGAVMQKVAIHQHHTTSKNLLEESLPADAQLKQLEEQISAVRGRINSQYAVIPDKHGTDVLVERSTDDET